MVRMSELSNTLKTILNAERAGKRQVNYSHNNSGFNQTIFKGHS
jgi:hypothetical protein